MSTLLVNPVVGLVVNTAAKTYHPIYYREAPLPGPETDGKPVRHKSGGHRTEGFASRDEAVADAQKLAKQIVEAGCWSSCALCLEEKFDLPWDGEDVPADVAFFNIDGEKAERLL